jgi:hypothetical protein
VAVARALTASPILIAALLASGLAYHSWNALSLPPTTGYDTRGHRQYMAIVAGEHRLPHPLEGWSTFHPPLYYLLGSPIWNRLSARGEAAQLRGVKAINVLSMLAAGWVAYALLRRLGATLPVAGVATALVLYVPCASIAGSMFGNEALGVGLTALALPFLVRLQADPRDLRAAGAAGLLAGLALATKFTGIFVAAACAVPFLRPAFDRSLARPLALCALLGALVAAPIYLRNVALTGSPIPMPRSHTGVTIRERRATDYLWFDPAVLLRPSVYHVAGAPPSRSNRNPAMANVWGLAYAGFWYDPYAHRIPRVFHRDGVIAGILTTTLGLVPTGLVILGFLAGLRDWARRGSATADAPILAMGVVGLASFVAITLESASTAIAKGSYLLPLAVPAAVFFARGCRLLPRRSRAIALLVSLAAAAASAAVFANGLVFPLVRSPG